MGEFLKNGINAILLINVQCNILDKCGDMTITYQSCTDSILPTEHFYVINFKRT